jgi:hypothetical protein
MNTPLGANNPSVGTKIAYNGLLKVQNRPKNPIFVPENLSIYILDLVCCGILQSDVFSDCQAQTHRSQVL